MANKYLDGITVAEFGRPTGMPRTGKLLRALGAWVIVDCNVWLSK